MNEDLERYIEGLPALSDVLPYRFRDGKAQLERIGIKCAGECGQEITENHIHGEFIEYNEFSVSLKAFAVCYRCKLVSPAELKFASDGNLLQRTPDGWIKGRWGQMKYATWWDKIKIIFQGEKKIDS